MGRKSQLMRHTLLCTLLALLGVGIPICQARAQQVASLDDLRALSITQLANVEITSVSKRPQPISAAPAAAYVITADDIRRSGARNIQEALSLAPNLEVARLNSYNWTITARGFNSPESSNKLLVLIDGRSVYSPLADAVYWESLDVPVSDIERIEVLSGPGGSLYGANAVNGVIDIITRNSADTKGFAADLTAGNTERTGTVRYGGTLGDHASFRVYGTGFDRNASIATSPNENFDDAWRGGQLGFRADQQEDRDALMLEGDIYENSPVDNAGINKVWGGSIQGRWTRQLEDADTISLLAYYDNQEHSSSGLRDRLDTYDIQLQKDMQPRGEHTITWGGEARISREDLHSTGLFFFAKPLTTIGLGNIFAQDQIALNDALTLTTGLKTEYNTYSGIDWMPSARIGWRAGDDTLLWAAISRAVRTPSKIDRELQGPGILLPSPHFESEELTAYELGYRSQPLTNMSLSVSLFYNVYNHLRNDPYANGTSLPVILANGLKGNTYGMEVWGTYGLADWWRLNAGFNLLEKDFHLAPGQTDFSQLQAAGEDPHWQAQLRSDMNITSNLELETAVRGIGQVERLLLTGPPFTVVPAYVEADAKISWQFADGLVLSLDGRNLLHNHHLEVNDPSTSPSRDIERSVYVSLRARL